MYSSQKGLVPYIVWFIGCFLIFIPIYGIWVVLPDIIIEAQRQPTTISSVVFIGKLFLQWCVFFSFFAYLALFCFKLFPSLALTKYGISCIYIPGMLTDFIKWDEIARVSVRKNLVFLIIFRSGLPIFNGLHINSLYGRLFGIGIGSPIILLSQDLKNREELVTNIRERIGS
jgi:hypothetical protein